jgi:hypothetical protein
VELQTAQQAADLSGPAAHGSGGRVVLADDNADMRDYLRRLLVSRFEVEAVPDGEAALAAARRQRPDLVLSDVVPHTRRNGSRLAPSTPSRRRLGREDSLVCGFRKVLFWEGVFTSTPLLRS